MLAYSKLGTARPTGPVRTISRNIAAKPDLKMFFGPFNVTQQVSFKPPYPAPPTRQVLTLY